MYIRVCIYVYSPKRHYDVGSPADNEDNDDDDGEAEGSALGSLHVIRGVTSTEQNPTIQLS